MLKPFFTQEVNQEMLNDNEQDNRYIPFCLFIFFLSVYLLTSSGSFHLTDVGIVRNEVLKSIFNRFDLSIPADIDTGLKGMMEETTLDLLLVHWYWPCLAFQDYGRRLNEINMFSVRFILITDPGI